MIDEGDFAPDFELYGVQDGEREMYWLNEATREGDLVLLLFYPFDFSPVCTEELCAMRDAAPLGRLDDLRVWAVSADSLYAHAAFAEEFGLDYPLLTDSGARVAGKYGVRYEWWDGHHDVPKRAVFLVDRDQRVAYRWHTENAYERPDFGPVEAAVERLAPRVEGVEASDLAAAVDYDGRRIDRQGLR